MTGCRSHPCWALGLLLAVAAAPGQAAPVKVAADWFACDSGDYAISLPKHYPSLHGIGKHQVIDLEVQQQGAVRVTDRRIVYIGMRLDLRIVSDDPTRYRLREAEVTSRRWNIGRLSVGQNPWRWRSEAVLDKVALDGPIELVGKTDAVLLQMRGGRIESASFRCGGGVGR